MGQKNGFATGRRLALIAIASALLGACGMTPDQEASAIEQGILAEPSMQELFTTIRTNYPEDFAILVQQLQDANIATPGNEALSEEISAAWLQEFFAKVGPDSVRAPSAELIAWSLTEGELYAALQRSSANECAAMTMGEWVLVDESNVAASAAIVRRNTAMVRASAAGRDNPQTYDKPSEADLNRLGDSIAATGIDPELQAVIGSDVEMAALSPDEQCKIGVAFYTGISELPDDEEPKIAAYMLSPG